MKVFRLALFGLLLVAISLESYAFEAPRDTVLINGQIISIRADVEIDTLAFQEEPKWRENADFAFISRMSYGFNNPQFEHDTFFLASSHSLLPEFGFEVNHPFSLKKSKQLNYRAGFTVGFANRFIEDDMDPNTIGFINDGLFLHQIIAVEDDLSPELDTLYAPIVYRPHVKLNLGVEWHGIMRGARGWRFGAMVEYAPIKHQLIRYEEFDSSDLTDDKYLEIDVEDTYEVEENVTSYIHARTFASWSSWNSPWFIRVSVLWSTSNLHTGITLGYIW